MICLIDYENVSNAGLNGVEKLTKDDEIVIFLREHNTFNAKTHIKLEEADVKKRYVIVNANTKNALDFQLVADLTLCCSTSPDETFFVISKDQGYDAAIKFLAEKGFSIQRKVDLNLANMPSHTENKVAVNTPVPQKENAPAPPNSSKVKSNKKANTSDKAKILAEVKKIFPDFPEKKQKKMANIVTTYKRKSSIKSNLSKAFAGDNPAEIYQKLMPLLKDKT